MAIALMVLFLGIGINVVMLRQPPKRFPRFAETCQGCGCQAPPMEYPPAVAECPICQWMANQRLHHQLALNGDRIRK